MKFRGGYAVPLAGRPDDGVHVLALPSRLVLPLTSRRLRFTQIEAAEGARVEAGSVLARDPDRHGVPLLAPQGGTVRLGAVEGHVVLEDLGAADGEPSGAAAGPEHVAPTADAAGEKRRRLVERGAWAFFSDAYTGDVPDPFAAPQAIILSTLNLEPFAARGDIQMKQDLGVFTRGLEQIQTLMEYQPIHLVLPDIRSAFARQVRQTIRGFAWVNLVDVPLRYPFDDFALLARHLGLKRRGAPAVWALRTEGVLAVDRALTLHRPCTERVVSLGGPAVAEPTHLRLPVGCPMQAVLDGRLAARPDAPVRVLDGGALTGRTIENPQATGLDVECTGLTVLDEATQREFLGWARPGLDRQSYSRCFLSRLRRPFDEPLTTSLRGEPRACVSCLLCEDVCPTGVMPHVIHKYLYQDDLERAEAAGVELCTACGLCSYVCPSKIELCAEMLAAQEQLRQERLAEASQSEEGRA